MAGKTSPQIKKRIRSLESTRQITKAMEMVASSALHRSQPRLSGCRLYAKTLQEALDQILVEEQTASDYLLSPAEGADAWIVFAGDRGLAGGCNQAVLNLAWSQAEQATAAFFPVGRKAAEFFRARNARLLSLDPPLLEQLSAEECFHIARMLCQRYLAGDYRRVSIVYTQFRSVLSQIPRVRQILPLIPKAKVAGGQTEFEPDSTAVLEAVVPELAGAALQEALWESRVSDAAARRCAMDAATDNAGEMIDRLRLQYNRSRQAAITREITEIVAGS